MNLFKTIKNIFVSHKDNNHRPHILRGLTLIIISAILIFLLGISYGRHVFLHKTVLGQSVESSVLIDLTNEARLKYGDSPLLKSDKLEAASLLKASDMIENNYFSHNSPTGVSPWYWIKKAGYNFIYAGENLAIDFTESSDVQNAWLESPAHKANILNDKFTEIGISTKLGNFNGSNTIFVVEMFGTPNKNQVSDSESKKTIQDTSENPSISSQKAYSGNKENKLNTLIENNDLIVVSNSNTDTGKVLGEFVDTNIKNIKYSSFFDRFIFNLWFRLNVLYKIIIILILISLLSFFFVEFKKHHWKHILYGVLFILFIMILLYLNYLIL
ncbi:MAG: CAP domain-containing protein [Candidatus Nomurabacteria bacterium]